MKEIYRTVKNTACAELVEKRSRFISTVKPAATEAEAVEFINELKQKYWDATHNVYAYIIEENNIMRYSDDGEPSGTAGMPVLDILKKEGLTNLVVVVTRYFGGILLGTGGLVHTYSRSAKQGVLAAQMIDMLLCRELRIKCDYTLLGKIQNEIHNRDIIEGEVTYTDNVEISLFIPVGDFERFKADMVELTNAKAELIDGATEYKEKLVIQKSAE
ncbi:MAG: YigZ family protein [Clostridiales bacterium]|nr:YigZ family protein [Clostridiales bacterium]